MLQFSHDPKRQPCLAHADTDSICLDRPVNPPHKSIRRQKAHRSRQQTVYRARQEAIAEEQETRDEAVDIKFGVVEDDAVEEDPEGAAAADEDGLPPPVVVLSKIMRFSVNHERGRSETGRTS